MEPNDERPAGASTSCPHSDLHIEINNAGFGDSNIHYLEIKARCKICDKPLAFRGAPLGLSPMQPTMAFDGSEIRIPFLVEGEEYDGKALGFTGRQVV